MNYKEIQKLKKSELRELLATSNIKLATMERANSSLLADLESRKEETDAYIKLVQEQRQDLQLDIQDLKDDRDNLTTELIETEDVLIEARSEENDLREDNIILNKRLECLLDNIDMLETENKIHKREKSEARDQRDRAQKATIDLDYQLSNAEQDVTDLREAIIKLDNESEARRVVILETRQELRELAEGSTPKNMYIHETNTIFADSGELHLQADDNKSVVFNCSNLIQDLATINDIVIKEAKKDLSDSIQQIKQLNKDI